MGPVKHLQILKFADLVDSSQSMHWPQPGLPQPVPARPPAQPNYYTERPCSNPNSIIQRTFAIPVDTVTSSKKCHCESQRIVKSMETIIPQQNYVGRRKYRDKNIDMHTTDRQVDQNTNNNFFLWRILLCG